MAVAKGAQNPAVLRCMLLASLVGGLLAGGCESEEPVPPLRLKRIDPVSGLLFLNQTIRFVFDQRIDPDSVNAETLRILDDAGHQVLGSLQVSSNTVSFIPLPPTSVDLSNGSYQPGGSYRYILPCFPLANTIRGSAGEILREVGERRWKAVSVPLPEGFPSEFLPSSEDGMPFHVSPIYSIGEKGAWIRLQFNRPLYPPTALARALRLWMLSPSSAEPSEIPFRKVAIHAGIASGGYGSVLVLEPHLPLESGRYLIEFLPGSKGLLDYATNQLHVMQIKNGEPIFRPGGGLQLFVDARSSPAPFWLKFASNGPSRVFPSEPQAMGLPGGLEGVLEVSKGGLHLPMPEYENFNSLGSFEATGRFLQLNPSKPLRGEGGRPLGNRWDFDRFIVPKGKRVTIILKGALSIRVLGRFEVHGELLVRNMEPSPPNLKATSNVKIGDPRITWSHSSIRTKLQIEVQGLCRLSGRIGSDDAEPSKGRTIPGYIWGRGPFLGAWQKSALQAWQKPTRVDVDPELAKTINFRGRWVYLSDWLHLNQEQPLLGKYRLTGTFDQTAVKILVQGRFAATNEESTWVSPELLSKFPSFKKLRVCLVVDAGRAGSGDMLELLEIW